MNSIASKKPRKPIPKVSKTRAAQNREYAKKKKVFLELRCFCFKCYKFVPQHDKDLHHWFGRVGALLCYEPGFVMACRDCHTYIEAHRKESIIKGWRAGEQLFNRPSLVLAQKVTAP